MVEVPKPAQPTVDAIWRAREDAAAEKPRYEALGVSASSLGHPCDRKLWLDMRWASPPEHVDGRKLRIFERGDIEEDRVIDDLRRAGVEITREQDRFSLARGWLRGKIDAVGVGFREAPKAEHVVEIKSAKAADWRGVVKHGVAKHKPEHYHQIHIGMYALGIDRGAYVIVNKDTEEIWIERIRLDPVQAERDVARVERLAAEDTAPLRIADSADKMPCRFCPHKTLCHGGTLPERRHCRTCLHFTFAAAPAGHCDRWNEPRGRDAQREGCPVHLFLPSIVPGEQIDASVEDEWVEYRLADGATWKDGGEHVD